MHWWSTNVAIRLQRKDNFAIRLQKEMDNSSRNTSPISLHSGRNSRQQHATVVMVSTLIDSGDDTENGMISHQNHHHSGDRIHMQSIHHSHHDDGSSTDMVLGQLSVNTNNSVNYTTSNIINNSSRSRIITHGGHGDFGLELIKQERQSHHMGGSEVSGGSVNSAIQLQITSEQCYPNTKGGGSVSSSSVIDDDLDQDDCDDGMSINHHHHQSQHHSHNHHSSQNHQHHGQQSNLHHSDSISSSNKLQHETLSVIVQPQDDSHEDDSSSQLLSPSGKMTPSSAEMIDTSDFRALHEPTYQTLTSVNDRMSPPGFSPNSSYATLTPLQPLPPISTMSDKFSYGHSSNAAGSFTVMQNNNMGISLGMGVNSPYSYDKLTSMGMSPPHNYSSPTNTLGGIGGSSGGLMSQQRSSLSPQSSYSQNGLHSPQKSMSPSGYDSPYGDHRDLLSSVGGSSGGRQTLQSQSPTLSPQSVSLHSPGGSGGANSIVTSFGSTTLINGLSTIQQPSNVPSSICSPLSHSTPPGLVQITHMRIRTPSPTVLTIQHTPGPNIVKQQHQIIATKSNNGGLLTTTTLANQQNNSIQSQPQNGMFQFHIQFINKNFIKHFSCDFWVSRVKLR